LIDFALEVIVTAWQLAPVDREAAVRVQDFRMLFGQHRFATDDYIGGSGLAAIRSIGLVLTRSAHG
jgi:hypothetical protein